MEKKEASKLLHKARDFEVFRRRKLVDFHAGGHGTKVHKAATAIT